MVASRHFHDLPPLRDLTMMHSQAVAQPSRWRSVATATRSVFDRYNITSEEDLREAVKLTTEHLTRQPRGKQRLLRWRSIRSRVVHRANTVIREGRRLSSRLLFCNCLTLECARDDSNVRPLVSETNALSS